MGGEGWCCIALPPAGAALCVREVLQGGRAVIAVNHVSWVSPGGLPSGWAGVQEWSEFARQLLGVWMCRAVRAGALQHLCDCEPIVGVQGVTLVWE